MKLFAVASYQMMNEATKVVRYVFLAIDMQNRYIEYLLLFDVFVAHNFFMYKYLLFTLLVRLLDRDYRNVVELRKPHIQGIFRRPSTQCLYV